MFYTVILHKNAELSINYYKRKDNYFTILLVQLNLVDFTQEIYDRMVSVYLQYELNILINNGHHLCLFMYALLFKI